MTVGMAIPAKMPVHVVVIVADQDHLERELRDIRVFRGPGAQLVGLEMLDATLNFVKLKGGGTILMTDMYVSIFFFV